MPENEQSIRFLRRYRLHPTHARAAWGPALVEMAQAALAQAEDRLGLALDCPATIIRLESEVEFHRYLGAKPTHVVAVARPERAEVVINGPAFHSLSPMGQRQTLIHESTHLILGRRSQGTLPGWLSEGLAMVTAGQGSYQQSWRLAWAATFGTLLPLEQLERQVAIGTEIQHLAYAQSLSVTRFFLKKAYPESPRADFDPSPLARDLADPVSGPALLRKLWDPYIRDSLEIQWRRSQRTVGSLLAVLSGSGFLWLVVSGLFLLAYWRKRRFARQVRLQMAVEEARDSELGLDPPPWEYEADEHEHE